MYKLKQKKKIAIACAAMHVLLQKKKGKKDQNW